MTTKLIKRIAKYIELSEKQNNIVKDLYEHTEYFEKKYESDYPEELFRFFAGKITRHAKEVNTINSLLEPRQLLELREYQLFN